jgi:hypothetical protein
LADCRRATDTIPPDRRDAPITGGTITPLKLFLNVRSEEDFVLAVSWLLAAFLDHGPYPVLGLAGEHGTGKSTFSAILRALIDPNTAPLRALPREERDLFIAANNGHVLSFDNVSGLAAWISDGLCRLSTGGGFATRTLHTNEDETLFDSSRPIILNGIEDIISRPDLADRALLLTLEPIPKNKRLPQKDVYASLEKERPAILGALLTAVSNGLRRLPETKLEELPRMADFAIWATACGVDLWGDGKFQAAYDANLAGATETIIEADTVATALRSFMVDLTEWRGTATELLAELIETVTERISRDREWPRNGRALSGRLRRAAPMLREVGIKIAFPVGHNNARLLTIYRLLENGPDFASCPSGPSCSEPNPNDFNGETQDANQDAKFQQDANQDANQEADFCVLPTVRKRGKFPGERRWIYAGLAG